jgi:UDP-glucose 4-epimerase
VHVSDLARAHVSALGRLESGRESQAINLGTGTGSSVAEVVEAVGRVTNAPVARTLGARRPGDPPTLVADASLARSVLGWKPEQTLDDIVRTAVRWATSRASCAPTKDC